MRTLLLRIAEGLGLITAWLTGSRRWRLLFDRAHYGAGALHFIFIGRFCDRSPHPLFDPVYYARCNPDVAESGWEPFAHFFRAGIFENRNPHSLFDCAYYLSRVPAQRCALLDYLETAPEERLSPHPLYDAAWMELQTGRRVPLEEFLTREDLRLTSPHPLFDPAFFGGTLTEYLANGTHGRRSTHLLFDAAFYLESKPPVDVPALLHYVTVGRRQGRNPHPLFDTAFYRANNAEVSESGIDPLVHYLLKGGVEGSSPHPLFDGAYYLENNPDVASARINPLVHFLAAGASEDRKPNPGFDTAFYMRGGTGGLNPLVHYVLAGMTQGRRTLPDVGRYIPVHRPGAIVDVIVPVYGGLSETIACIDSLLACRHRNVPHEIVVVDDCSPDRDLEARLKQYAGAGEITLIRSDVNLGFPGAANRGMELHRERDVVLLNSDTAVANDWLTRLQSAVWSDDRTATATPFTNSGSICSYPRPLADNEFGPADTARMDAVFREANAGRTHEIPTAVGFCMYIRRECLDETGLFDAETFGRGYGEENDFCRRAAALGWRHVLAADVFVYHRGGASFSGAASERKQEAFRTVCRLHPDYARLIGDWIRRDPAAPSRTAAAVAELHGSSAPKRVAIACHECGEVPPEFSQGAHVLRIESVAGRGVRIASADPAYPVSAVAPADRPAEVARLLRECGVTDALVLDGGGVWPEYVAPVLLGLNAPFDVMLREGFPYTGRAHGPVRVAALLSCDSAGRFDACAYIRALLPFGHESVNDLVRLVPIRSAKLLTDDFDAVLVQRTAAADHASVKRVFDWVSAGGRRLIYETDDNLLAMSEAHPDWLLYRDKRDAVRDLIERADAVMVSTDRLATALLPHKGRIFTLPNALDERLWLTGDREEPGPGVIRALYMGTMTHREELELLREAVGKLRKEVDFRLEVVGVTAGEDESWYERLPVPPDVAPCYPRFVRWLKQQRRWHFGVAPLAANVFSDAKSHLKYLDYAALGLPGVFSAGPAYSSAVKHGASGLLTENLPEAWYQALSTMVRNGEARTRMAAEAMADLRANHTLAAQREMRRDLCGRVFGTVSAQIGPVRVEPLA